MLHRLVLFLLLWLTPLPAADWYLFTSFRGNGEDGLHLALSPDGYRWETLAGDQSFLKPGSPGELMRDPFLIKGPDGLYHLIWTWNWYRDAGGLRLGHATSRDLIRWNEAAPIPVMREEPTARNAWAPQMLWDNRNRQWLIYWATTIPGRFPSTDAEGDNSLNHRIYSTATRDFHDYTPTRLFYDPGFSVIDTTILDAGGQFVLFLKDERRNPLKKNLRMASAKEAGGPYTGPTEPFTGDWVEGPTAIRIGNDYLVYFDHYQRPQHYGAMRSTDLKTWEDVTAKMTFPAGQRHGTVVRISANEAKLLRGYRPTQPVK